MDKNDLVFSLESPNGNIERKGRICRDSCFHFKLRLKYNESEISNAKNVNARIGNYNIVFDRLHVDKKVLQLGDHEMTGTGEIEDFHFANFMENSKKFLRCLIPTESKIKFYEHFKTDFLKCERGSNKSLIEYTVNKLQFHMSMLVINDKDWILIDCMNPILPEEFRKYCYSTLLALGFVSGHMPYTEYFIFEGSDSEFANILSFSYKNNQGALSGFYHPIYAHPYAFKSVTKSEKKYDQSYNYVLDHLTFSNIIEKIHNENDFLYLFYRVVSANSNPEPSSGCITYFIALEILANLIHKSQISNLGEKTRTDSKFNELIESLDKIVKEKFSDRLNEEELTLVTNRISNLGQLSNHKKFLNAFETYGIVLNKKEKEALKMRDRILHGHTKMNKSFDLDTENKFVWHLFLRLFTMVNRLILTIFKYKGMMLNYTKIFEDNLVERVDEEYMIEIQ